MIRERNGFAMSYVFLLCVYMYIYCFLFIINYVYSDENPLLNHPQLHCRIIKDIEKSPVVAPRYVHESTGKRRALMALMAAEQNATSYGASTALVTGSKLPRRSNIV